MWSISFSFCRMCLCKLNASWNESRREIHPHPFFPKQTTEKVWCCTNNDTSDVFGEGRLWGTRNDSTAVKGWSALTFEANSQCVILVLEQSCPAGLRPSHSLRVCCAARCPPDGSPVCRLLCSSYTGVQSVTCPQVVLTSAGLGWLRLLGRPSPSEKGTFPDSTRVSGAGLAILML